MPDRQAPWWAVWVLAYTVLLAFIAAIFVCLFRGDADNAKNLLIALISVTIAATAFYWGKSSGEDKKADLLAASTPPPSPADSQATADALNAAEALRLKTGAAP